MNQGRDELHDFALPSRDLLAHSELEFIQAHDAQYCSRRHAPLAKAGGVASFATRWTRGGSLDHAARASARWKELLETYEQAPLDEAIEAELVEFVERRAVELGDPISVGA